MKQFLILIVGIGVIVFLFSFWEVEEKLDKEQVLKSEAANNLRSILQQVVSRASAERDYESLLNELLSYESLQENYPALLAYHHISHNKPYPGEPNLAVIKLHNPRYELIIYFDGRVECYEKDSSFR